MTDRERGAVTTAPPVPGPRADAGDASGAEDAPLPSRRGARRALRFYTSPPDQPPWARPALLAVAALAAAAYAWRLGSRTEIFYAAADRSMSTSWHAFFFGAFDPAATISLDKLPGAFWVQALFVRAFGAHTWAVALPQATEGVLTVLVLFRVVRRCTGPTAAILAAGLLAIAPATMTLDRGNVADTLLVLLLVLAADSLLTAARTHGRGALVMAGVWVGLAFQTKMLEAWLVLPALALCYLLSGRESPARRVLWSAAMVAIAVAVSSSWMVAVSLVPQHDRPYVDGTTNDSVVSQVFDYNGFGRVGQASPNQVLGRTLDIPFLAAPAPPPSATRLVRGAPGRDTGWLLPAALLSVPALLWARRRRPRTDLQRAAVVLWGTWLAIFVVVFSLSAINTYYLGALSPPIAVLLATAATQAWAHRRSKVVLAAAAAFVAVTVGTALWLLPASGTGLPGWLPAVTVGLGVLALIGLGAFALSGRTSSGVAAALATVAAMVLVPLVASGSVVTNDLGAFDTPFQPTVVTAFNTAFFGAPLQPIAALPTIEHVRNGAPYLLAAQTSVVAAPFIFATGEEALPIGGYDGATPHPTLPALEAAISRGQFHLVLRAPHTGDRRIVWIAGHCTAVRPTGPQPAVALAVSYCLPSDTGRPTR